MSDTTRKYAGLAAAEDPRRSRGVAATASTKQAAARRRALEKTDDETYESVTTLWTTGDSGRGPADDGTNTNELDALRLPCASRGSPSKPEASAAPKLLPARAQASKSLSAR